MGNGLFNTVNSWVEFKKENGYKNDLCSAIDNDITLKVDFDYPGATRYFTIKVTNTGSITAKIPDEPTVKTANSCFDVNGDGSFSSNECGVLTDLMRNFGFAAIQIGDGSIVPYNEITNDMVNEFMDAQGNKILKPRNSLYYVIEFGVSKTYGNQGAAFDNGYFMLSTDLTFEIPFEQITN